VRAAIIRRARSCWWWRSRPAAQRRARPHRRQEDGRAARPAIIIEKRPAPAATSPPIRSRMRPPTATRLLMGNNSILATMRACTRNSPSARKRIRADHADRHAGQFLVVNPQVPAHSLKELIALAKAQPGKIISLLRLWCGGASAGGIVQDRRGVDIVHVPTRARPPCKSDRRPCADHVCDCRLVVGTSTAGRCARWP